MIREEMKETAKNGLMEFNSERSKAKEMKIVAKTA